MSPLRVRGTNKYVNIKYQEMQQDREKGRMTEESSE